MWSLQRVLRTRPWSRWKKHYPDWRRGTQVLALGIGRWLWSLYLLFYISTFLHLEYMVYLLPDHQNKASIAKSHTFGGFPGGSDGKESACNSGDLGSVPGSGRSPGEGVGNPLQYSCLENFMDRGTWRATVHGVTKSWTRLSDLTPSLHFQGIQ